MEFIVTFRRCGNLQTAQFLIDAQKYEAEKVAQNRLPPHFQIVKIEETTLQNDKKGVK
jgi:hypothetical protein